MAIWSRSSQPQRLINVGLDFGTSSSKIIWRDVTGDRLALLGFAKAGNHYSPVCLPSAVKIAGDQVLFGHDAEADQGNGWLVRSLKVCVACRAGAVECRNCSPAGPAKRPGAFALTVTKQEESVSADELAALVVGYVMKTAKERIQQSVPGAKDAKFTWNMSAPLDQFEFRQLRGTFERLAYVSSRVADQTKSGMALSWALENVRHVARKPLPASDELPVSIVPEAIAAVHAYCQSPLAKQGLYALVDVGAGTTTVSFFRHHQASSKSITCYASSTGAVGADDMDRALFSAICTKYPQKSVMSPADARSVAHEIRAAKEQKNGMRLAGGLGLDGGEVLRAIEPIARLIYGVYVSAFRKAYVKEALSSRWEGLTLMFVGGGSLLSSVRRPFDEAPDRIVERIATQMLELPAGLAVDGIAQRQLSPSEQALLSVAFGLSFSRVDIPDYWHTAEVEPLGAPYRPSREPDEWRE